VQFILECDLPRYKLQIGFDSSWLPNLHKYTEYVAPYWHPPLPCWSCLV